MSVSGGPAAVHTYAGLWTFVSAIFVSGRPRFALVIASLEARFSWLRVMALASELDVLERASSLCRSKAQVGCQSPASGGC